jgi:23S rRNA (guanosine2251-2'-O)-methyltransferase
MTRVIAGRRPVLEAIRGRTNVRGIYAERQHRHADVEDAANAASIPMAERSRQELDRMCDGVRHQGVVAIADDYAFCSAEELVAEAKGAPLLIALDELTDPQNLGAIVRSAVTLGFDGLIIPKHRAAGITPAVVRASAGATEHAAIARVTNLQRTLLSLSESGLEIVGLDAGSEVDIRDLEPSQAGRVLVVGSEGKGLRRMVRQRCDNVVQIPQHGPMDSLNASVAAAIAMYEMASKRRGAAHDG